jgi:hypothetical protein
VRVRRSPKATGEKLIAHPRLSGLRLEPVERRRHLDQSGARVVAKAYGDARFESGAVVVTE